MQLPPFLARAALAAGIVLCLATWVIGAAIPYFDYDEAAQGIFINDLSLRHDIDASFEGHADQQEVYRTYFAAQRLAFSLPLSWLQRGLGLPPWRVEDLLRVAALVFGLGGSVMAAYALLPAQAGWGERFALAASVAAHPSLSIFVRTGESFLVFVYALFWLCALSAFRWLETGRAIWIVAAAAGTALCALNPYASLPCWVLAAIAFAAWEGSIPKLLRRPSLYVAAAGTLAAVVIAIAAMAASYGLTLSELRSRQEAFVSMRGHVVGLHQLLDVNPLDKLTKFVNQHLLFRVDALGDVSRDDRMWVAGGPQPVVYLWALATLVGLWIALRERSAADRRALAVTAALLLVFFTVSFPEGRYILVLLPCWAYFAIRAVSFTIPSTAARQLALGLALLLLAFGTERTIRRAYLPRVDAQWVEAEGIREAAPLVARLPDGGRGIRMAMPQPWRFESDLYFRMAMPDHAEWLPRPDFARLAAQPTPQPRTAALTYADDSSWLAYLTARGFKTTASLRGRMSGRELLLLVS